jgi:NAD-dependent deacetylase
MINRAAELLSNAKKLVILTGAGVSKESGIPTFRDAQTGLWEKYDAQTLASPDGFRRDPSLVWSWYDMRRAKLLEVKPNPGHYAMARLQELIPDTVLLTQNVDGLHALAGAQNPVELHGNITRFCCLDKKHPATCEIPLGLKEPPQCDCGSLMRPAVVWFGEALDPQVLSLAFSVSGACDVMLVAGTSGLVHPAAALPFEAISNGASVIEVNPDETPLSESADVFIKQPSGVAIPEIVRLIEKH